MTLRDTALAVYEAEIIAADEAERIKEIEEQERRRQEWVATAIATVERQRWIADAAPDIRYDYDRQCVWLDDVALRPVALRGAGLSLVLLTQCVRCGALYRTDEVFWPVESLSNLGAQLARQPASDAALCDGCCGAVATATLEHEEPA